MKRILWIVAGLLIAIGVLLFVGRSFVVVVTTVYSGVCTRCLQQVSGLDKTFLGFRYFHEEHLVSERERGTSIMGEQLPPIDPHTYKEIFGKACEHHFIRLGVGSYQGGLISDGGYSMPPGIEFRLALIENLYLTFHRIPDRELAQQSYALIDQYCPDVTTPSANPPMLQLPLEADALPNEPMSILLRGLPLIRSESDWKTVIEAVKAGNGNIGLLSDRDLLIGRLKDVDPTARAQALHTLATHSDRESWETIANVLDDPQIGTDAARQILWNKHFEYFDRVLAIWQNPAANYAGGYLHVDWENLQRTLTDSEIHTLLGQNKPDVDRLCFNAIEMMNRFQFLEELLSMLNQRPSPEAEHAIKHLLVGPNQDLFRDDKTKEPFISQWQALQDMYPNKSNPGGRIEKTNTLLREAFELGWSKNPGSWEKWRLIFEAWREDHAAESFSAAFAEAMYAVDPKQTVTYLNAMLGSADNSWSKSPSHILAAMGAIGSPEFLPEIDKFEKSPVGVGYDKNPTLGTYVAYAKHRCHRIQDWKLLTDSAGKYFILRSDGTSIH